MEKAKIKVGTLLLMLSKATAEATKPDAEAPADSENREKNTARVRRISVEGFS